MSESSRYWVSWYSELPLDEFEYHGPWWISGIAADDSDIVCAAVIAKDEIAARDTIRRCYDSQPASLTFRFCELRPKDWSPFSDRFERAKWMTWPYEKVTKPPGWSAQNLPNPPEKERT